VLRLIAAESPKPNAHLIQEAQLIVAA
jgi:hypothetical protein